MINRDNFLEQLHSLKTEYNIGPSPYPTNERDRCRIAILITEAYLKAGGDDMVAMFLERELYDELKHERLTCDAIHHEVRSQELKHRDWNPLKITLSESEKESRSSFVDQILYILSQPTEPPTKEVTANGTARKLETARLNQRTVTSRLLQDKQIHHKPMTT